MKILKVLAIGLTVVATYSCKEVKKEAKEAGDEMENAVKELEEVKVETVKFAMEPKSDSNVKGEVTFTDENGMVKMTANFTGLTPGEHAIHIHEKADCSAADGTSTGGHWNPTNEAHGKWGAAEGFHKGDIGNFVANADGTGSVEFDTDQWCLGCEDPNKDLLGKGVIVHQGVDDFTTQPTGNAGGRISCTGIIQ